jgi:hypothetical protein
MGVKGTHNDLRTKIVVKNRPGKIQKTPFLGFFGEMRISFTANSTLLHTVNHRFQDFQGCFDLIQR